MEELFFLKDKFLREDIEMKTEKNFKKMEELFFLGTNLFRFFK